MSDYSLIASAARRVAEDIGARIDNGSWPDGYRVPAERQLAQRYGLARNTVRRALRALEEQGRLVRRVGQGTFVSAPAAGPSHALGLRTRQASPADVMEVRLIIEPQVAALAAHRATAEELAEIESCLRAGAAARGMAEFEQWDARLHLAIFRASRNGVMIDYCQAINAARNQPRWYHLKSRSFTGAVRDEYNAQHEAIVRAIRDRDAEGARREMSAHLVAIRDRLLATG